MKDHEGRLQWLWTILCVLAFLLVYSWIGGGIANAAWMYDVSGVMAPTLENPVSASFTGEMEFTGETSTEGVMRISLTNEIDEVTQEPIVRESSFAMAANLSQPVGQRIFNGIWNDQPFLMQWLDYDNDAELDFLADNVDEAGWDAMAISFPDYQLGTVFSLTNGRTPPQVNEPAALALLAVGGVLSLGIVRAKTS
jgi:hypothetical protein